MKLSCEWHKEHPKSSANICSKKDGLRLEGKFYKNTKLEQFEDRNYRIPICKDCLKNRVYITENRINLAELKKILKDLDLPFFARHYRSSVESTQETIGTYFSILANKSIPCGWENSVFDENEEIAKIHQEKDTAEATYEDLANNVSLVEVIPKVFKRRETLRAKYGNSHELDELVKFERIYLQLRPSADIRNGIQEKYLIEACKDMGQAEKIKEDKTANSIDVKRYMEIANNSLDKVNLIEDNGRADALTKLFKMVELQEGNLDFIKRGYLDFDRDKIDKSLRINDILSKNNYYNGKEELSDEQYVNTYESIRNILKDIQDSNIDDGKKTLVDYDLDEDDYYEEE